MPRHPRLFVPGATYHVYCRVARGEFIFDDGVEADGIVKDPVEHRYCGYAEILGLEPLRLVDLEELTLGFNDGIAGDARSLYLSWIRNVAEARWAKGNSYPCIPPPTPPVYGKTLNRWAWHPSQLTQRTDDHKLDPFCENKVI